MQHAANIRCVSLVLAAMLCTAPAAHAADNGVLSMSVGFDYSSGKYGDTQSTDILYIPVIGKYLIGPWIFKLTVPYIEVTGPGNVLRDVGTIGESSAVRTHATGLGDVVAAVTYNIYDSGAAGSLVDVTGKIKFGTAEESNGLGTGENDYAVQVDWARVIDKFVPFASLGYRVTGDPPGRNLNNVFYGSVGSAYKLGGATSVGLALDLRQKSSDTGAPQREASLFVSHRLDNKRKLQGYVVKGFADGSPDWAVGGTFGYAY